MGSSKPKKPKPITDSKSKRTSKDIKIATSNLFILNSDTPLYGNIENLILQELSSGEIIDYGDNSLSLGSGNVPALNTNTTLPGINGNAPIFVGNPISSGVSESASNISAINNPTTILIGSNSTADYLNSFSYTLSFYLPNQGTGDNGESVYIDSSNNLIINTVNIQDFQEIEVEFWNYETEINDTIVE
jgi:hypothetical protein